jgi:6-phosphogluconolactonase
MVENIKYPPAADDPKMTSKAHRVTVSPGNGYLMVNDLGLSCIHVYKLDATTAKLTPADPPEWKATPGAGCRGLRWHPNKKIAYCINELHPTVNVLSWDEKKGVLTSIQEVRLVPENYTAAEGKGCAPGDIVFDKKMQHGYVTSRLDDFMATFKVEKDFKLTLMEHTTSGGIRERDCTLDPTDGWILVANPDSNNIAVMKRDQATGRLSNTVTTSVPVGGPQCLIFPERPNVVL